MVTQVNFPAVVDARGVVADASVWQTIGPFFPRRESEPFCTDLTELHGKSACETRIVLSGQILERDGQPMKDAIVEIWQPDAVGLFAHPADPRVTSAAPNFLGWMWCATDGNGWYHVRTIVSGRRADTEAGPRLPHINMMLLASVIMCRLTTAMLFGDDPDNADDRVLAAVPCASHGRLFARRARMTDEAYLSTA